MYQRNHFRMYPLHRIYPRGVLRLFPYILLSICVCNACVYACVRVSARLQGKREGWAFILLLPVLLEQIYRLSIALRYPALIGTPINELFNRFLSCVFQIFLRMLFFFYTVRNRSVKYILIVPRYRKIS